MQKKFIEDLEKEIEPTCGTCGWWYEDYCSRFKKKKFESEIGCDDFYD